MAWINTGTPVFEPNMAKAWASRSLRLPLALTYSSSRIGTANRGSAVHISTTGIFSRYRGVPSFAIGASNHAAK